MAPVPASAEALREPGEGSPGSCRDRAAKAWRSPAAVRGTERASAAFEALSAVQTAPQGLRGAARGAERQGGFGALSVVLKPGDADAPAPT